jgi:hypothetical protein
MDIYPVPAGHRPTYAIGDGRHRWGGAVMEGAPIELRCDVITDHGHALRIIPVVELCIDLEVQFQFAFYARKELFETRQHVSDRGRGPS